MSWDVIDKKILEFLQGDIPLVTNPFHELAKSLDITEENLVNRIKYLEENGVVRRFGAVLRHQKAGYDTNAMVGWLVDEDDADRVGALMAEHPRISHCYLRDVPEEFAYNLFTMIHAKSQQQLDETLEYVSKLVGINDYKVLKSIKELKKVSMKYI
ncbi:MAG TPA: Lrp/AsnC family transcriptional regulator [Syntrophomonadaceae bacterium]|nr:Lrp/AsnC family transcriptional regulator [Syntrophomonadaceae bacterium]